MFTTQHKHVLVLVNSSFQVGVPTPGPSGLRLPFLSPAHPVCPVCLVFLVFLACAGLFWSAGAKFSCTASNRVSLNMSGGLEQQTGAQRTSHRSPWQHPGRTDHSICDLSLWLLRSPSSTSAGGRFLPDPRLILYPLGWIRDGSERHGHVSTGAVEPTHTLTAAEGFPT